MAARVEHRFVEANGITFHVAIAGRREDPAVLCLHGFPEGWMSWRPVMEGLGGACVFAPDLRGYHQTEHTKAGYDVFTLTDDIKALIEALQIHQPVLVGDDWGGELAWIFAHRYSHLIHRIVAINGPHPKTLVRAVIQVDHFQTFRLPWVPFFELPWLPEFLMTTAFGKKLLKLSFTLREGTKGTMNVALVDELVASFRKPEDVRGPINYYREMVKTQIVPKRRKQLEKVYAKPISVPITLVWGLEDEALPVSVALKSSRDAGREVEWRPLPGVGHFVSLEAPEKLAQEICRVLEPVAG